MVKQGEWEEKLGLSHMHEREGARLLVEIFEGELIFFY